MRLRLIAALLLAALPAAAAETPPVYAWIHPTKTDLYAMTMLVTTRQHFAGDFDRITGVRTGYQQAPVNDSTMTVIVQMLRKAASRGPCAAVPDDPPYTITLYDTTRSGKARAR